MFHKVNAKWNLFPLKVMTNNYEIFNMDMKQAMFKCELLQQTAQENIANSTQETTKETQSMIIFFNQCQYINIMIAE